MYVAHEGEIFFVRNHVFMPGLGFASTHLVELSASPVEQLNWKGGD
jgi:hypothetical protein